MGFLRRDICIEHWLETFKINYSIISDKQYIDITKRLKYLLDEGYKSTYKEAIYNLSEKLPFSCYLINSIQSENSFGYYIENLTQIDNKLFKNENLIILEKNFSFYSYYNLIEEIFIEF